jgi:hypothetical protein
MVFKAFQCVCGEGGGEKTKLFCFKEWGQSYQSGTYNKSFSLREKKYGTLIFCEITNNLAIFYNIANLYLLDLT